MLTIILIMVVVAAVVALISVNNYVDYMDEIQWPEKESSLVEWKDKKADKEYDPILIDSIPSKTMWKEV